MLLLLCAQGVVVQTEQDIAEQSRKSLPDGGEDGDDVHARRSRDTKAS